MRSCKPIRNRNTHKGYSNYLYISPHFENEFIDLVTYSSLHVLHMGIWGPFGNVAAILTAIAEHVDTPNLFPYDLREAQI